MVSRRYRDSVSCRNNLLLFCQLLSFQMFTLFEFLMLYVRALLPLVTAFPSSKSLPPLPLSEKFRPPHIFSYINDLSFENSRLFPFPRGVLKKTQFEWVEEFENVPLTMKQFFCISLLSEKRNGKRYFTSRVMDKLYLSQSIFFISFPEHLNRLLTFLICFEYQISSALLRSYIHQYYSVMGLLRNDVVSLILMRNPLATCPKSQITWSAKVTCKHCPILWIIQVLKKINKVLSLCFEFQYFPCHGFSMLDMREKNVTWWLSCCLLYS